MTERFAIYFMPPEDSPLWAFGTSWLGRDPAADRDCTHPDLPGLSGDEISAITASPRRYGFHATLKPPFRLADGTDTAGLLDALEAFAGARAPFDIPALELRSLDGFLAFVPREPVAALNTLARDCVEEFDRFRRPPPEEETLRRRASGLTARQDANLARWGYPYVMDDFRFHMTLTDRLPDDAIAQRVQPVLAEAAAHLTGVPVQVDAVALFHEPAPGADFRLVRRIAFADPDSTRPTRA